VAEAHLDRLLAEPLLEKYSPFPGPFERGVVACTGSEFCRFAIVETKERAVKWARWMDEQLSADDPRVAPSAARKRYRSRWGVLAPTKGDSHALLGLFRFVRTTPDR